MTDWGQCTTLDGILQTAWDCLQEGVTNRRHGYHLPVLASLDEAGLPTARIVVLRGCDPQQRTVRCHTDQRAPKVAQLRQQTTAAWTFYDPQLRMQIRARGTTVIHTSPDDTLAANAWERTGLASRRCYLAPQPPSTPSESASPNLPPDMHDRDPTAEESAHGEANFSVVQTTITQLDWFGLKHDGHRRAQFAWDSDGSLSATWLEP